MDGGEASREYSDVSISPVTVQAVCYTDYATPDYDSSYSTNIKSSLLNGI